MNNLSSLLYLSNFFGNLSVVMGILFGFSCIGLLILVGFGAMAQDMRYHSYDENPLFKLIPKTLVAMAVTGFLLSAIPDRQTTLLIAASQTGEAIMQTPIGTEAGDLALDSLKLLRDKINQELAPDNPS